MSEVVHTPQQEFWQPPAPEVEEAADHYCSGLADACPCGTEFLLTSHFCHSCGTRRPAAVDASAQADAAELAGLWQQAVHSLGSMISAVSPRRIAFPSWLRYLHFHEIKSRLGLSMTPLIAFLIGMGCLVGALLVGFLTAKTLIDWQAIQFYRAEWLLAATAAFVAGILLKNRRPDSQ